MNESGLKALGQIASGLFVLFNRFENKDHWLLCSFVNQVSFDPLRVSIAVKPSRGVYDTLKPNALFSLNILSEHQDIKIFFKKHDEGQSILAQLKHEVHANGIVYLKESLGALTLRYHAKHCVGDHDLIIADVLDGKLFNEQLKPKVHVRKSGSSY